MIDYLAQSDDYKAMLPYWRKASAIESGVEALRTAEFIPRFPAESDEGYRYRVKSSVLTNIFSDICESLAAKPFTREVGLATEASEVITRLIEDIDRSSNHLHVLAQQVFLAGVQFGVDWLFVDYTQVPEGSTLVDEQMLGARPYVVRVTCFEMLEVRSEIIGGEEAITYVRMNETDEESEKVRILYLEDGGVHYELWERKDKTTVWNQIGGGALMVRGEPLRRIPVAVFYTGRRVPGTWRFTMPMKRVADLQIEHYLQESNLKLAKEQTAFPMLVGAGVSPPIGSDGKPGKLEVGPGAVLFAPMNDMGGHGSWSIIEPATSSLQFLAAERDKTEQAMRELGRQPLTAGTAGLTQVAAAYASQRASSAVQAWAFILKDALENALRFCAVWLGIEFEPTVYINTDFAITIGDEKAPDILVGLEQDGIISRSTLIAELKRRGILSEEVDEEEEAVKALNEFTTAGREDQPTKREGD